MTLASLYLKDFRNFRQAEVEFSPKLNLIRGSNAQGKTNLLEAIYLLGTGRSFRTLYLDDLITYGSPFFFLEASFFKDGVQQTVAVTFDGEKKKMEYNQTSYNHFSNLLGLIPVVLIAPDDMGIVEGSPSERRRFLDLHLAQQDPLYVYHLTRYLKAMKQRNCLLKKRSLEGIEAWEKIMISSAAYLQIIRDLLIAALKKPANEAMSKLSGGQDSLEVLYEPSRVENYEALRARELHLGLSLAGPHRDDMGLLINGKKIKAFASQGQKRCAVTALRLSQWRQFYEKSGVAPIMGIDDFGVHLDGLRSHQLMEETISLSQTFLTSPYPLPELEVTTIYVEGGSLLKNASAIG